MSKDQNFVNPLTAVLNTNGKTIVSVLANPITHILHVNDGTTGSDFGPANALRDNNDVPTLLATSSADGLTPVVCYADNNGAILINSN